jgi:hypothetical protein
MLKATFYVDIGRVPEDVYQLVSNHENDVRWQSAVARVVKLSPGAVRAGSRFRHTLQLLGVKMEAEVEIAETRASEFHAFSIVGGPFAFDTRVSLVSSSSGTKVRTEIEGRANGVARLAAITLSRIRRGEIERDLRTLKRLMEAREL